jgi:hypothetical protein
MGVNAGSYATSARGAIQPAHTITAASWAVGTTHNITAATKASPVVVTSAAHGFANGDVVWIKSVSGMTQLNSHYFTVKNVTANTFQLYDASNNPINGTGYSTYSSGGTVQKCQVAGCQVVVTSASHGFANNDQILISGVAGMTQINNATDATWQVSNVTANTFALVGTTGPSYSAYTSGGSAYCTTLGCPYYRFTNASNVQRVLAISSCVSERIGPNAYTDASPGTALVGYNYASTNNPCDAGVGLIPLTTDTTSLHTRITALQAAGSTAAQTGTAWGWYMLSPSFGLWTGNSVPAAYGAPETAKIAVLMTDGAFNTAYCNGVIAQDSISGSGSASDHINCNATNGSSHDQTLALCAAMKQRGIIIYTVGFHLDNDPVAQSVFSTCATDAGHFFLADDGVTLQAAFQQIGQSISQLRITH